MTDQNIEPQTAEATETAATPVFTASFQRRLQDPRNAYERLPEEAQQQVDEKYAQILADPNLTGVQRLAFTEKADYAKGVLAQQFLTQVLERNLEREVPALVGYTNLTGAITEVPDFCGGCDELHGVVLVIPQENLPAYLEHREAFLRNLGYDGPVAPLSLLRTPEEEESAGSEAVTEEVTL